MFNYTQIQHIKAFPTLLTNSPNLKEFVKNPNNVEDIIDNKYPDGIFFEFGKKNLLLKNEYDRYSSLQHAKVINPKIEDGYFIGTIVDYYDFKKRPNTFQNLPNNWGFVQQEKGNLRNYYICVKIKVRIWFGDIYGFKTKNKRIYK